MPSPDLAATYEKVDVLIIGAGPAGLMCALGLARGGINVKIIDQRAQKIMAGQADGISPRSSEIFESYGLREALYKGAAYVRRQVEYDYDPTKNGMSATRRFDALRAISSRYPFFVTKSQGLIEDVLIGALHEHNVTVERPYKPTSIEVTAGEKELEDISAYPVSVKLVRADNTESSYELKAKFLVGADGAHSWVRKTLGIVMEGESTPYVWGAVDFHPSLASNFPDWRVMAVMHAPDTTSFLIPREDDQVRIYINLGSEDRYIDPSTGRSDLKQFSAERLLAEIKKAFRPYTIEPESMKNVAWWTAYSIGQRVAAKFCVRDRAFIVGDACHTHSPNAAQGMNTSFADSHNLAWKLALVLRGQAKWTLLKTYELERRTFAEKLIAFDKWYTEGFRAAAAGKLQDMLTDEIDSSGPFALFRAFSGMLSGCENIYPPSDIVTDMASNPSNLAIGARLPPCSVIRTADRTPVDIQETCLSDGRFKVLVFGGELMDDSDIARLQSVAERLNEVLTKIAEDTILVISILKTMGENMRYGDVPRAMRSHWTSVLEDTASPTDAIKIYDTFGIGDEGALLVVRPDGYIAAATPLDNVQVVGSFLQNVLKPRK